MRYLNRLNRGREWMIPALVSLMVGCSGGEIKDPGKILADTSASPTRHQVAIDMIESEGDADRTVQALKHVIAADGYVPDTRLFAYRRLKMIDQEALLELMEVRLPRTERLQWRRMVCEEIASEQWIEMTPTLIRAWARPVPGWVEDGQRPERLALVEIYGEDKLPQVLLQVMLDANPITAANLRARCWELLVENGEQDVLRELLANAETRPNDGMVRDLSTIASKVGVVPRNREEVLWARALCDSDNKAFVDEVEIAASRLPEDRRKNLEMRDLSVVVAASRHAPSLLDADDATLYGQLETHVKSVKRRIPSANFEGWNRMHTERLHDHREALTWGDLAVMLVVVEALEVPQVLDHIFDQAERDLEDRTTEYGGVLALDDKGRFVLKEFPPRRKGNDKRFEAPQAMFDAGYTAIAHYHNHAQEYENGDFAGPHMGDFAYARNTRANCLVFTFLDSRSINVDFYRHGRLVVDLGVFRRPD